MFSAHAYTLKRKRGESLGTRLHEHWTYVHIHSLTRTTCTYTHTLGTLTLIVKNARPHHFHLQSAKNDHWTDLRKPKKLQKGRRFNTIIKLPASPQTSQKHCKTRNTFSVAWTEAICIISHTNTLHTRSLAWGFYVSCEQHILSTVGKSYKIRAICKALACSVAYNTMDNCRRQNWLC